MLIDVSSRMKISLTVVSLANGIISISQTLKICCFHKAKLESLTLEPAVARKTFVWSVQTYTSLE